MFFEGSEKKVELVVRDGAPKLRSYGRTLWEKVVERSRASVLSEISNEHMDAYLLSESSLFVSDQRVLMITCGTTTLVHAVTTMLEFIAKEDIELLIYERKREIFPEYQRSNFFQDTKILDAELPGKAYRFGDEDDHHIYLFHMEKDFVPDVGDMTLEVLMHGLDRQAASVFEAGSAHNESSIEKSGVRELLPGYQVDDFIFDPQGYSLNAIKEDKYFTIHVTPQKTGSYVSFETNHNFEGDMDQCIRRVLEVFRPKSLDILLFEKRGKGTSILCDYETKRQVRETVSGFDVTYNHYFRKEDKLGRAELLEIEKDES